MRKQRVILEHRIHVALPRRQFAGRFTKNANGAARKLFKSGNQAQAGGFAACMFFASGDLTTAHNRNVILGPAAIGNKFPAFRYRRFPERDFGKFVVTIGLAAFVPQQRAGFAPLGYHR